MNNQHTTQTLNYYNQNAAQFSDSTQSLDFASVQDKFLSFLQPQAHILDFGCGPGRDTKYFLSHGCSTDATYVDLMDILKMLARALKKEGILYASFKYGDFEGMRNGRYFIDMTEDKLQRILQETDVFQIKEKWISSDVRPGRDDEKWMNMILVKKNCI